MQALGAVPRNLTTLAQQASPFVAEWRLRRLLKAGYWSIHVVLSWFAWQVIETLPHPEDGIIYLITDGGHKDKRGKKNPAAQRGRKSKHHPWFFGIKFVVVMLAWDVYRIPVDFRIVLPKEHKDYKKENVLFREMFKSFTPPEWAKAIITVGDSAFGSAENMKLIKKRDKNDRKRIWGYVFAIARTWKTDDEKYLSNIVLHTRRELYRKTWIPKLPEKRGRKTYWIFGETLCLNHIGEVSIVFSKRGPNVSPKKTKILVTNLIGLAPRQVISIYQKRWSIELLMWELKSGVGLGEHQVRADEQRIEKSFGIAITAYLFLLRIRHRDISPGKSWSIFQLQNNFRLQLITNQVEHNMELKLKQLGKVA